MAKQFGILLVGAVLGALALHAGDEGIVTARLLNVRMKPELRSPAVMKLRSGAKVDVLAVRGEFYEIAAPATTPVYVSEVFLRDGKVTSPVNMRSDMAQEAPSYGLLPAGAAVTVERTTRHNWAKITPPAGLKLYVAKSYVKVAALTVPSLPVQEEAPATTAKPVEDKPVVVKPVEKPAEAQPAMKQVEKPAEAEKATVKQVEKPAEAEKPAVKPVEKPAEAEKTAVKPVEATKKPETVKPAALDKADQELKAIGADLSKGEKVTASGYLVAVPSSTTRAADFALMKANSRGEYENSYFVCSPDNAKLKKAAEHNVELSGTAYRIPNWKTPVLKVEKATLLK